MILMEKYGILIDTNDHRFHKKSRLEDFEYIEHQDTENILNIKLDGERKKKDYIQFMTPSARRRILKSRELYSKNNKQKIEETREGKIIFLRNLGKKEEYHKLLRDYKDKISKRSKRTSPFRNSVSCKRIHYPPSQPDYHENHNEIPTLSQFHKQIKTEECSFSKLQKEDSLIRILDKTPVKFENIIKKCDHNVNDIIKQRNKTNLNHLNSVDIQRKTNSIFNTHHQYSNMSAISSEINRFLFNQGQSINNIF